VHAPSSGSTRATIKDVAERSGVSPTTVSHVFSGNRPVAGATRDRVIAAARELNYEPHVIARILREQRSGILALVIRELDQSDTYVPEGVDYFTRLAGRAAVESLERGYGLMLTLPPTDPRRPSTALIADGFILADPIADDPVIDLLNQKGIPFVSIGRDIKRSPYDYSIVLDIKRSVVEACELMRSRGARSYAFVGTSNASEWTIDLRSSFVQWCGEAGVRLEVLEQEISKGDLGGVESAEQLLAMGKSRPDAILCITSRIAVGVARTLQDNGVRVPEDAMIVAGVDSQISLTTSPTITSIDQLPDEAARLALSVLDSALHGERRKDEVTLHAVLRQRGSTDRA
jgi:DNA-binding LacI/PurR family transcriptional regulator